jgi:transcription termination/antitermination protein NusA
MNRKGSALIHAALSFSRGDDMSSDESEVVARLFAQEVPEIAAGIVEIRGIARRLGDRSKIAVSSNDPQVDCVGVCIGLRGNRLKKIIDQLDSERIDIVRWHDSPERMIRNALQPATIEKITFHDAQRRATVTVKEDQLSLALGRRDVNRDLASQLCGWNIELVTQ